MALIRDVRVYASLPLPVRKRIIGIPNGSAPGLGRPTDPEASPGAVRAHTAPHPTFRQPAVLLPISGPVTKGRSAANTAELSGHSANNQSLLLINFDGLGLFIALRVSRWSPIEGG